MSIPGTQLQGVPIQGVADFVCDKCGFIRPDANIPNTHKCRPRFNVLDLRAEICAICEANVDGVCTVTKERYPDRAATVEVGTQQLTTRCPRNHWLALRVYCPDCERPLWDLEGVSECPCGWKGETLDKVVKLNPQPFPGEPIRHLLFFFCPKVEEPTRYHLNQLKQSVGQFNGRKICCVAKGARTLEKEIQPELESLFDEIFYVTNTTQFTEAMGFIPLLERIESTDPNECFTYAHSKGMRSRNLGNDPSISADAVRNWTQALYENTVRNWEPTREALEAGYAMAGSFKWDQRHFPSKYGWHYSGTFYTVRSAALYSKPDWRNVDKLDPWSAERYPGIHFLPQQGFNLHGPNIMPPSLYRDEAWTPPA